MTLHKPVLVPYQIEWEKRSVELIGILRRQLGSAAIRIEHIGSTAIPLMAAKDVIDLQVSVIDLDSVMLSFDHALSALGFRLSPFRADHVPAGSDDDPAHWKKLLWTRHDATAGNVNVHVREDGSPNERLALLFRDWFRAHPGAIPAYSAIKQSIAAITSDTGVYADVKDPVVDLINVVAEAWADQVKWQV